MAYQQYETSPEDASPCEMYLFKVGDTEYRYTSDATIKYLGGKAHVPENIDRTEISQTSDSFKQQLTVSFPKSNLFAHAFVKGEFEKTVTLVIYRWHTGDPDGQTVVYWRGRVIAGIISGNKIDLGCESVFTSIKRAGLKDKYELNCRHALYGENCGLQKSRFGHVSNVTAYGGADVKFDATNPARPSGFFSGGLLEGPGFSRFIVEHKGNNVLSLDRPIPPQQGPVRMTIFAGCDKSRQSCSQKFANLPNYGGFPWIPTRNPFEDGI